MDKFKLAFGIHNHQPVGNFEHVFEEAHQKSYRPFLELLSKYKNTRISLHQSGILWNWQKKNHPRYFHLVQKLIDSGQIELLTGGFYEPILSSIPSNDAINQIDKLTSFLHDEFKVKSDGLWLTERIWEPHLPEILADAGVRFLPIDDTHFLYAGWELSELNEPFITETEGKSVILLPILKRLRYLIPFGTVDDVISELKKHAEKNPNGMAVYADDGEKFGVWPNTYQHCYEDGWLEKLFDAIEQNSDWLQVVPLSEVASRPPKGRAYLPTASYEEMLHWSLPTKAYIEYENFENLLKKDNRWEQYGRFVRGGHWRGFLSKYEESNLMHKKMLRLSKQLDQYCQDNPKRNTKAVIAQEKLFAAQCNCPYWHGIFGGLYLPHIRKAIYSNLVEAEKLIRGLTHTKGVLIENVDYDIDGQNEFLFSNEKLSTVWKPSKGGTLLELSLFEQNVSLTDTLSRRSEGYHSKLSIAEQPGVDNTSSIHDQVISKEEGLDRFLVNDWYLKRCFIDHFLGIEENIDSFTSGNYVEEGDFIIEPYKCRINESSRQIIMIRKGRVLRDGIEIPIKIEKQVDFDRTEAEIEVTYNLSAQTNSAVEVLFAVENNFNFQAGHADDRFLLVDGKRPTSSFLDDIGSYSNGRSLAMLDQYQSVGVAVQSDVESELWHLPIFTVSLSEGGFEKVYQGTSLIHCVRLSLSHIPTTITFHLIAGSCDTVVDRVASREKIAKV